MLDGESCGWRGNHAGIFCNVCQHTSESRYRMAASEAPGKSMIGNHAIIDRVNCFHRTNNLLLLTWVFQHIKFQCDGLSSNPEALDQTCVQTNFHFFMIFLTENQKSEILGSWGCSEQSRSPARAAGHVSSPLQLVALHR